MKKLNKKSLMVLMGLAVAIAQPASAGFITWITGGGGTQTSGTTVQQIGPMQGIEPVAMHEVRGAYQYCGSVKTQLDVSQAKARVCGLEQGQALLEIDNGEGMQNANLRNDKNHRMSHLSIFKGLTRACEGVIYVELRTTNANPESKCKNYY